ncbi:multidrug resistance regulator 1 [Rhypophila sp. PSN 637]
MSGPSDRSEGSPAATELRDRERDRSRSEDDDQDSHDGHHGGGDRPPPRKRQRVRLSCLECRRRKLSCDREFPCSRCLQSGTADRCEYETRPGIAPPNKLGLSHNALAGFDTRLSLPSTGGVGDLSHRKDSIREAERIRRLELEVAQLKSMLAKQNSTSVDGSTVVDRSPASVSNKNDPGPDIEVLLPSCLQYKDTAADKEVRFFRGQEFKNRYFGPHSAFLAFTELSGLCPFMKETSEEWLRPLHIHHGKQKDRKKREEEREERFSLPDRTLEALLPSKDETDTLVSIYLDQFEQIHRVLHVPSFKREYAKFWDPSENRTAAFTALVICILATACCLNTDLPQKFIDGGMVSSSLASATKWVSAAEEWLARQSQKHRRLIHYQIMCLIYLAKKINTIKKKRFWKGAGELSQDAISVALHREPSRLAGKMSPFTHEMRRRIWATIQSFDVQAAFDFCLPTIHGTLNTDAEAPRNIDDDEFDEDTEELPPSKPPNQYTYTSFQHLSRQSLPLRLELSRVLTSRNTSDDPLDYDEVIRYTNEINQEIDALPSWDVIDPDDPDTEPLSSQEARKKPLLAYTMLHIELRQYIIPLHQPFLRLRKQHSRYQYSEIIYYNAARDMVLLHDKVAQQGIKTLNFLREDNLTLAINLCSVTMLQPRNSTNMIMINSSHTLQLMEKCLGMKEDRLLRCGNNEPWGYSIMCAAFGLLEAHLGVKTPEAAKASSAERFVGLHYKLLAGQDPPVSSSQASVGGGGGGALGGWFASSQQGNQTPAAAPTATTAAIGTGGATYQVPPSSAEQQQQAQGGQGYGYGLGAAGSRSKSATPFSSSIPPPPPGSLPQFGAGTTGQAGPVEVPGTPWWMPNSGEGAPGGGAVPQLQLPGSDFSMELLGLNLNELWGADQWDFIE